jgi:hypothetical protein
MSKPGLPPQSTSREASFVTSSAYGEWGTHIISPGSERSSLALCPLLAVASAFKRFRTRRCASSSYTSIVHVLTIATRTSTPGPTCTTPTLAPVVIARASLAGGRWSYECKVDGDFLLEELFVVGALDRSLGFVECGVLNEDVSLVALCQHQSRMVQSAPSKRTFT